jgi:hypothetical protein
VFFFSAKHDAKMEIKKKSVQIIYET